MGECLGPFGPWQWFGAWLKCWDLGLDGLRIVVEGLVVWGIRFMT